MDSESSALLEAPKRGPGRHRKTESNEPAHGVGQQAHTGETAEKPHLSSETDGTAVDNRRLVSAAWTLLKTIVDSEHMGLDAYELWNQGDLRELLSALTGREYSDSYYDSKQDRIAAMELHEREASQSDLLHVNPGQRP